MQVRLWLESVVRVVRELGGYFTFEVGGEEYVIIKKSELEAGWSQTDQAQKRLLLDGEPEEDREGFVRVGQVMERFRGPGATEKSSGEGTGLDFNNEIRPEEIPLDGEAMNDEVEIPGQQDEDAWGASDEEESSRKDVMRVRFEPLRGDLPPELQE